MKAEIEVVPCKICGDKSSGVHYGVITCEGCKGFFRRSHTATKPFHCQGNQNCVIERTNRNRCQYCRWKKCIELGMSRESVKFGRMSKKQRETVEGEVVFHKKLKGNAPNGPHIDNGDTAVNDTIEETSNLRQRKLPPDALRSHPLSGKTPLPSSESFAINSAPNSVSNGTTAFTALSPVSSGYSSSHTSSPIPAGLPPNPAISSESYASQESIQLYDLQESTASNLICGPDSLTDSVLKAYICTSTYTPEQKQQLKMAPLDYGTFWKYRNMHQPEWWTCCTVELNPILHQIVEFAKLTPGFSALSQDDQIILLKEGSLDIAIIRMATMYDLNSSTILFAGVYIPATLFQSNDQVEARFIQDLFMLVQELASFNLTETEIALYSAMALMWPHRTSLEGVEAINGIYQRLTVCLESELRSSRHINYVGPVLHRLRIMSDSLRRLSAQHLMILGQFLKAYPQVDLPPLYREIFGPLKSN